MDSVTGGDERFLATVRQRAGDLHSEEAALRATSAVLGVLGERLAGGAAERLATSLPEAAASALRGGGVQGAGAGADEFLAAVARREGLEDQLTVSDHVQAVFRTVAETADREALDSAREQLTAELRGLWAPEEEGDTGAVQTGVMGDPDAKNLAGPERPVS